MKRLFFLSLIIYSCHAIFAQGLKVKDVRINMADLSASTALRMDAEGTPCGLVKVQTKMEGMEFGINVVGEVENKINEYWVYLSKGTKEIMLIRPDYLPTMITLSDFGVESIEARTTYTITLKEENLNPEKCGVTIHVKPREAQVKIDDVALKQNPSGDYKVLLPKGEHLVRIDAQGHRSDIKTITTGKGVQDINVELESLMADINIISQTGTAEIFVDEKSMGVGGWKGKMIPGKHVVEVRQEGYVTATNQVTIAEKEQRTITIPKLTLITASLSVSTIPSGCVIFLDGEYVGVSPCTIPEVLYGSHLLTARLDSCGLKKEKTSDVLITDNKPHNIKCEVVSKEQLELYEKATSFFERNFIACERRGGFLIKCDHEIPELGDKYDNYDYIINLIDDLDIGFFLQHVDGDYVDQKREHDEHLGDVGSGNWRYGDIILWYLSQSPNDEDYMKKVIPIALKMGEELSVADGECIGDFYARKRDYNNAQAWYDKAIRRCMLLANKADTDEYRRIWLEAVRYIKQKRDSIRR